MASGLSNLENKITVNIHEWFHQSVTTIFQKGDVWFAEIERFMSQKTGDDFFQICPVRHQVDVALGLPHSENIIIVNTPWYPISSQIVTIDRNKTPQAERPSKSEPDAG